MANININLETELKELGLTFTLTDDSDYCNDNVADIDADGIVIYCHSDEGFEMHSYKLPKTKEVNVAWVMNKWTKSTDTTYVDFAKNFNKILNVNGHGRGINIYPTTYGIGVSVIFINDGVIEDIKILTQYLNDNSIDYKMDMSEVGWVRQFKISKSQSNLTKIKNLKIMEWFDRMKTPIKLGSIYESREGYRTTVIHERIDSYGKPKFLVENKSFVGRYYVCCLGGFGIYTNKLDIVKKIKIMVENYKGYTKAELIIEIEMRDAEVSKWESLKDFSLDDVNEVDRATNITYKFELLNLPDLANISLYDEMKLELLMELYKSHTLEQLQSIINKPTLTELIKQWQNDTGLTCINTHTVGNYMSRKEWVDWLQNKLSK